MTAVLTAVGSLQAGVLKIQLLPFKDWDPAVCYSQETTILDNIYERLLFYDPTVGEIRPVLATSWDISDHGRIWTFHLRPNVFFHNGEVFNAEAVKFSVERTKRFGRGPAWIWNDVRKIQVIDELTVEFHCTRPLPLDLISAGRYGAYIVPPKLYADRDGARRLDGQAVGTGPYRLEKIDQDGSIHLARFDRYWAGWKDLQYETVIYQPVQSDHDRATMLENGELDIIYSPHHEKIEAWSAHPDLGIMRGTTLTNRMYQYNHERPPTDDRLVRLAIRQAIDIPDLIQQVFGSSVELAQGPLPRCVWSHLPFEMEPASNSNLARETLLRSRYGEEFALGSVGLTIANVNADSYTTAVYLKDALTRIGFDVKIEPMSGPLKPGSPDMTAHLIPVEWTPTYITPSDWLINLFCTDGSWNIGHYSNTDFDRAVTTGYLLEGRNREKASRFYETGQRILVDEVAGLFICDERLTLAYRKSIQHIKLYPAYSGTIFVHELAMEP